MPAPSPSNSSPVRHLQPSDWPAVEALYRAAFPDEDLAPLVAELSRPEMPVLSLIAHNNNTLLGHVAFTLATVDGHQPEVALLGPLAIAPDHQRRGLGGTLVRAGLQQLSDRGVVQVHVLGDPAYYSRFGFRPDQTVSPPYALPDTWADAWQAFHLKDGPSLSGKIQLPAVWLRPELWTN